MIRFFSSLIFTTLLAGIAAAEPSVYVVATTPFLQDIARNVGGTRVQVDCLVPPSADLHLFEPSAADVEALVNADLVIINGLELEGWIEKLIANSGFKGQVVTASDGIEVLSTAMEEDHDHDHAHEHGASDPHAWMNPRNAMRYAENICAGLVAVDAEGKPDYESFAHLYIAQLRVLDGWVKREVSKIPTARKVLVTEHATLHYFAKAYGFETRSLRGITTRDEPDAQAMAELVDYLRAHGVSTIFTQDGQRPRSLGQLKDELGDLQTVDLYVGTLQPPGQPVDSYIAMIRHDVRLIVGSLQ
ncbi:zinc ABC transporter substrate-binding protein [bacterium]|nr:zinc ABC transporter substrate-binding protein [bacterium]